MHFWFIMCQQKVDPEEGGIFCIHEHSNKNFSDVSVAMRVKESLITTKRFHPYINIIEEEPNGSCEIRFFLHTS